MIKGIAALQSLLTISKMAESGMSESNVECRVGMTTLMHCWRR
jgi:hypothetical protein